VNPWPSREDEFEATDRQNPRRVLATRVAMKPFLILHGHEKHRPPGHITPESGCGPWPSAEAWCLDPTQRLRANLPQSSQVRSEADAKA
jgi:hypothetical protein